MRMTLGFPASTELTVGVRTLSNERMRTSNLGLMMVLLAGGSALTGHDVAGLKLEIDSSE